MTRFAMYRKAMLLQQPAAHCKNRDWESRGVDDHCRVCTLHFSLPIPDSCIARAVGASSSGRGLAATDLEDIGDGNGLLGALALGADDGDGRPGHGERLPVC